MPLRPAPLTLNEHPWFMDGSLPAGASCLIAGAPGSRKSGLATQLALDLARQGIRVLILASEETRDRVWDRVGKMISGHDPDDILQMLTHVCVEKNPPAAEALPDYLAQHVLSPNGRYGPVKLVIVDSVQGQGLASSATRAYDAVLRATRMLAAAGICTLLINQMTKANVLTGPRRLEHGVDVVMVLRATRACRLLFTIKNRFGPASLREPVALLLDPVTLRLAQTPLAVAAPASAKTYLGAGPGMVDVQASVTLAAFGSHGRLTAPWMLKDELKQLIATIATLPEIDLDDASLNIDCRMPGHTRYSSAAGLALAMALLSSYLRKPIPPACLFLGDIDLSRGVRPIDQTLLNELNADLAAGISIAGHWRVFGHMETAIALPRGDIKPIACEKLETAVYGLWPDLH